LTWIKPSFLWMMYRCGWGTKAGQETVLAIEITRDGFEWALRNACLSSYVREVHPDRATWQRQLKHAPTRIQWDPERDLHLHALPYRSLQLGLAGEAVQRYADEWTVAISDVTPSPARSTRSSATATSTRRHGYCPRNVPTLPQTNCRPTYVRDHNQRSPKGHMAAQARRDGSQAKYPVRDELGSVVPDGDRSGAGGHGQVAGVSPGV